MLWEILNTDFITKEIMDFPELITRHPVDTERKLNVLCTFNLRPASTRYLERHQSDLQKKETKIKYLKKRIGTGTEEYIHNHLKVIC